MVRSYTIDESLVAQAVKASGNRPVEQVLTEALQEYAQRRHAPKAETPPEERGAQIKASLDEAVSASAASDPRNLIALFGTIDSLPSYDPLTEGKRRTAELSRVLTDKFRRQGLIL